MRNRSAAIFLLGFGFGIIPIPLFAHHGNAAYDYEKTLTIMSERICSATEMAEYNKLVGKPVDPTSDDNISK